jgi:hypothetical protein
MSETITAILVIGTIVFGGLIALGQLVSFLL